MDWGTNKDKDIGIDTNSNSSISYDTNANTNESPVRRLRLMFSPFIISPDWPSPLLQPFPNMKWLQVQIQIKTFIISTGRPNPSNLSKKGTNFMEHWIFLKQLAIIKFLGNEKDQSEKYFLKSRIFYLIWHCFISKVEFNQLKTYLWSIQPKRKHSLVAEMFFVPTLLSDVRWSVSHTFKFSLCWCLWTLTESF